jgi:hypothetical protein
LLNLALLIMNPRRGSISRPVAEPTTALLSSDTRETAAARSLIDLLREMADGA